MIEERGDALGFAALKAASTELSQAYREERAPKLNDDERVTAYLLTRMPATYAGAMAVMRQVRDRIAVASVLDVGAGTGAASLAVRNSFPNATITMIERDVALAAAAREFLPDATVVMSDVKRMDALTPHDLVIAAWSAGEFGMSAARRLWQAARVALVVIEPGTPRGFTFIRDLRDELLEAGAHMLAPCPGSYACPVVTPDWCHFAARVERSSLHRRVKGGDLGYEDEKFSYIAVAREPVELPRARIVGRPQHQPGRIVLPLCTAGSLTHERATKRDRETFRAARQANWGDAVK